MKDLLPYNDDEIEQVGDRLRNVQLTEGALRVLDAAQRAADRGKTWGYALLDAGGETLK